MIYLEKPKNFDPIFETVSCFIEHGGKILLLHRQDSSKYGDTWGMPAGKMEPGETIKEAVLREVVEETGIEIPEEKMSYFRKLYVRYPECDFIYHIFNFRLDQIPDTLLNKREHKGIGWFTPQEALKLRCIPDLDNCIKLFYGLDK